MAISLFTGCRVRIAAILASVVLPGAVRGDFLVVPNPPDVDKAGTQNGTSNAGDDTCWLATASNLLASVGYGPAGAPMQQRALGIYADLYAHFGAEGGKTQNALNWWLNSSNNDQPTNPYRYVDVYGHTSIREPYKNSGLKSQIINEQRNGNRVGLSISWPEDKIFHSGGRGGHAIATWGDDGNFGNTLPVSGVYLTDSDSDNAPPDTDKLFCVYDDYDNPNPNGPNGSEGKGWYINYKSSGDNAFIKNICVLRPLAYMPVPGLGNPIQQTRRLTGSLKVKQNHGNGATALSFDVDSSGDIYDYQTLQDYDSNALLSRSEFINDNGSIDSVHLNWNFSSTVPFGANVTLTNSIIVSDLVSPYVDDAKLEIKSPKWHYLGLDQSLLKMDLKADVRPTHFDPNPAPDAPEGFIVASFDFFPDAASANPSGSYRFMAQYSAGSSDFVFDLEGVRNEFTDGSQYIGNLRFGHSDGNLSTDELWSFDNWLAMRSGMFELAAGVPLTDRLGIDALLPHTLPEILPDDLVPEPAGLFAIIAPLFACRRRRRC